MAAAFALSFATLGTASPDQHATAPQAPSGPVATYASKMGCHWVQPSRVAYRRTTRLLHHYRPVVNKTKVRRYRTCVATKAKARAVGRHVKRLWRWRHSYGPIWRIRFNRLPAWSQSWAWSTGACESGNNPRTSTGNGFYGAFQWVLSTWHSAGGPGSPVYASWHHQAVLAVRWHGSHPSGQWPVCGE